MLQIKGQVVNIYTNEAGTDKDGKAYDERHKVQLLGAVSLPNGDLKNDLIDLTVDSLSEWNELQGKTVAVDVGAFAPSKGQIIYYIKKGSNPQLTA